MASADGFSERVSEAWDAEGLTYDEQDMISERLDDKLKVLRSGILRPSSPRRRQQTNRGLGPDLGDEELCIKTTIDETSLGRFLV